MNDRTTNPDKRTVVNRRTVMKAVGGTTVGLSGFAGVASAGKKKKKKLRYNFYGCSQVCVNKRKRVTAVVWDQKKKKFRFACIKRSSNRNDPPVRDWKNVYCYAVGEKKAIVGICYKGEFIENENRCAENYPKPKKCKNACDW
jgi:hypothetical protein